MKFSLVMATLGRSVEIERLFGSLVGQAYRNFELLVVDQNEDDRVRKIVNAFRDRMEIVYLRSEKGLSRARNVGLRHVRGDLVAFPDDDCWYGPDVLARVVARFRADGTLAGVTGRSIDGSGAASQGRWALEPLVVNKRNVWTCATSYTIFLRAAAAKQAGDFDETLGVGSGSRWGAGEEVNYLLKVLAAGMVVRYDPALTIFHPEPIPVMDEKAFSRARLYNRGFGRVLGLNGYPFYFVFYLVFRSVAGCVVSALKFDFKRAKYYWIAASQRLLGWAE
jgi:glycosyltransferase involved in cell wall biosynthesis